MNVPVTGSPDVVTVTWASLPSGVLTVIPFDGSAPPALAPGVIVTAGPAGDGLADALAVPPCPVLPGDWVPLAPDRSMMVVVLPVHPVTASANAAPAATAEIAALIALMSAPFPPFAHAEHRHLLTKTIHRDVPTVPVCGTRRPSGTFRTFRKEPSGTKIAPA